MGDVNRNNNNNIDDGDIIPPNFPPPPKALLLTRSSSINNKHTSSSSPVINQHEFASTRPTGNPNNALNSNKPDLFNFAANNNSTGMMDERISTAVKANNPGEINANNCQSSAKLAYPLFFCDDQNRQLYNAGGPGVVGDEKNSSFYFYHHEPPTYLPNYDNISSNKYPDKYSTMPSETCPAGVIPLQHFNIPISKVQHASTCNLNNQFNSSNLINSHHFSNSLNNFNMMDTQIQNYYNFNPSFTQLPPTRGGGGGGAPFGSSSIIGSSFASNISLNGTPKNQNMPWKHRQCSSRSSSSGTNSSSEYQNE